MGRRRKKYWAPMFNTKLPRQPVTQFTRGAKEGAGWVGRGVWGTIKLMWRIR
ncbi:hypothetical protein KITKAT_52 [Arthrobacter phage Kitkat]|uniref:Uncharacterized protein n=1 Tax=Arthrobacter phage Kitkat TaxID=1796996 RepID=A0A140G6M8_9CAUD|nr:hypothetical protein BJD77_gp052 [Arthrobacter phage Kitkat]AMM44313.1 hypothetical protein KITKAT_52 [Arthrobacter phage Kitkat]